MELRICSPLLTDIFLHEVIFCLAVPAEKCKKAGEFG